MNAIMMKHVSCLQLASDSVLRTVAIQAIESDIAIFSTNNSYRGRKFIE